MEQKFYTYLNKAAGFFFLSEEYIWVLLLEAKLFIGALAWEKHSYPGKYLNSVISIWFNLNQVKYGLSAFLNMGVCWLVPLAVLLCIIGLLKINSFPTSLL